MGTLLQCHAAAASWHLHSVAASAGSCRISACGLDPLLKLQQGCALHPGLEAGGGSLYVSGVPGTGKTASVLEVMATAKARMKAGKLPGHAGLATTMDVLTAACWRKTEAACCIALSCWLLRWCALLQARCRPSSLWRSTCCACRRRTTPTHACLRCTAFSALKHCLWLQRSVLLLYYETELLTRAVADLYLSAWVKRAPSLLASSRHGRPSRAIHCAGPDRGEAHARSLPQGAGGALCRAGPPQRGRAHDHRPGGRNRPARHPQPVGAFWSCLCQLPISSMRQSCIAGLLCVSEQPNHEQPGL